jgi:hypothetical protein
MAGLRQPEGTGSFYPTERRAGRCAEGPDDDPRRRLLRQVKRALDRLAALSESACPSGEFYVEFLRTSLGGIDAPAGAVWTKSPQGFLQQQCQQNISTVGLDDRPDGRAAHNQLLRFAFEKGKPGILGPKQRAEGDKAAGNPTDCLLALAPILTEDNETLGLVEVFHKPNWNPQDLVTYTIRVAGYASNYLRRAEVAAADGGQANPAPPESAATARDVFLSWERFRLAYNLVLAGVVLLALLGRGDSVLLADGGFWRFLVVRALAANLCFGLGPWAEGWLRVAGGGGLPARVTLFAIGAGLSAILAAVSVFGYGRPTWD